MKCCPRLQNNPVTRSAINPLSLIHNKNDFHSLFVHPRRFSENFCQHAPPVRVNKALLFIARNSRAAAHAIDPARPTRHNETFLEKFAIRIVAGGRRNCVGISIGRCRTPTIIYYNYSWFIMQQVQHHSAREDAAGCPLPLGESTK